MPFTFAHPIYAAPLKRLSPKYFSLTGLILGSMAPDFEYFLMLEPYSFIGHSILGMFIQAIPLCILLAFVFHFIVKEALIINLPKIFNLDQRAYSILGEWRLKSLRDWIIFVLSVIVGFITHVTIDAFTHINGYFVIRFSFLRDIIFFNYPIYKLLQYALSLFGLMIIIGVIIIRLNKANYVSVRIRKVTTNQKILFWSTALIISAATTGLKIVLTTSNNIIGILVVAPISGLCLGFLFASLITRITRRNKLDQGGRVA